MRSARAVAAVLLMAATGPTWATLDIDALWEYADPAASETRFRAALDNTNGDARLELLTQIARTYSLRGRFEEAHRMLDDVSTQLSRAGAAPRIRYLLERGRAFNSAARRDRARPLFLDAWQLARVSHIDGLAVDAAHMVAITYGGTEQAVEWNQRGLALARQSTDAKAQALLPALLNNSGWDLHDMGQYERALPLFEQALAAWIARDRPQQIHFARWSVGRCLRSLGRYEDALAQQLAIEKDDAARAMVDGYVLEEIAESYEALGQHERARPYFARAAAALADDEDIVKNEPARLARLRAKGQ